MINTLKGTAYLTSTNTEDFIKEIIRLTQEGYEYLPHTGSMQMTGLGKQANFKTPVEDASEKPSDVTEEVFITTAYDSTPNPSQELTEALTDLEELQGQSEDASFSVTPKEIPDWDLVKSFKNPDKALESKTKLADYAKTFGVTLKKNISFEKMVDKFVNSL